MILNFVCFEPIHSVNLLVWSLPSALESYSLIFVRLMKIWYQLVFRLNLLLYISKSNETDENSYATPQWDEACMV